MAYVYRHIRLDKNEPFYVGIGSDDKYTRANSRKDRNKYWSNIVAMTNYRVDILADDISWEEACLKESEFISIYGRKDIGNGTLVNLTDGGDGSLNRKMSESLKAKLYSINKGKKLTQSHRDKISQSNAKKKMVVNKETGAIYSSVKQASIENGIGYSCLKNMLIGNRPNKTSLGYV